MTTRKRTVSVRLDDEAQKRVRLAARLSGQSSGAFLGAAGDERAREVLRNWAAKQHEAGVWSFSELAEQTGLATEEIMIAAAGDGRGEELQMFLASCRAIAETQDDPAFLVAAEQAVALVAGEPVGPPDG